ncbi:MAG: hypothetical protein OXG37_04420 [Actinomycetia bacterium]|nr:hypothetical protein [Actinomycetes bacterium]
MGHVLSILDDIREQIAADDDVLREARDRRNLTARSAMGLGGTLRRFSSGSVAHGTVNDPVTDADGGIVLDRRSHTTLGPDSKENEGPSDVIQELQDLVGPKVRDKYPNARVTKTKRGLKVFFATAVNGQDPTVDLVVTLTRKDKPGLWIPNLENDDWDASDPEKHTELFTDGSRQLRALRARVTRLAKAWNKQWDDSDRALSSFNIEALAWEYIDDSSLPLDKAVAGWFAYACDEIDKGKTQDPAGVSEPIRLLRPKKTVLKRLGSAADRLAEALEADDEDEARDLLAAVFRDYVDAPADSKSAFARALRANKGIGATKTGLAVGAGTTLKPTRAFGDGGSHG